MPMKPLSEEMLTRMTKIKGGMPPSMRDQELQGQCLLTFAEVLSWVKRVQALEKALEDKGK